MEKKNDVKQYYRRVDGILPRKSGSHLVLYPPKGQAIVLNETAAFLWKSIDGQQSAVAFVESMKSTFSEDAAFSEEAVEEGIKELLEQGVIEEHTQEQLSLPFLKVSFSNFWEGFNDYHNFLLHILQKRYTPLIVNPAIEIPDILFFGGHKSKHFNHNMVNRAETIKVGVYDDKEALNPNDFDVALATFKISKQERVLSIPAWVLHFDWKGIENETLHLPSTHLKELKKFNTQIVGDSLFELIENAPIPTDEELASLMSSEEPRLLPLNTGKITDFKNIKKGQLTIGMATYDDFDGVYFTIQSIRLYHPEVADRLSFIVIDNNPGSATSKALQELGNWVKYYKYLPFDEYNSTAVRDLIFREAETEYVMSVDSHILIEQGGIKNLLDWLDAHPECMDLLQGPLVYDDITSYATGMSPIWRSGMYGTWHTDKRGADKDGEIFEIPLQGCGLFACRKVAWLGFNPRFRGFGGEEGYIQEKFRQQGRKVLCLPALRWVHRFIRPNGTKYPNIWNDRIRNYYLGFQELGWDFTPMEMHFQKLLGIETFLNIKSNVLIELNNPFLYFDAVFYICEAGNDEALEVIKESINQVNLQNMVRLSSFSTEANGAINYEKAKAVIVERCVKYGFDNVIIIDNRAILNEDILKHLKAVIKKIKLSDWKSFYMSNVSDAKIESALFDKAYVAENNRPSESYIAAFNLAHYYELAAVLANKETSKQEKEKVELTN